jgi:hypothetical protein
MLWTIIVILLIMWLLGFVGHFGGSLIHLLLVIGVVLLVLNLAGNRRRI